ncbi:sugar porter family MFS transporter [Rhodohalobacter mucosus]|uniref:MFS transporter n=1 Tax=Rhodohalobacter mucosus TaxID=2079485 RepID=A0A316U2A7_9BACT|nr:sugar porter family MFS transporter [Rhodohalobacter mucosus]PWN07296.1 MFS transporter [Rhodohalobacter mucosus]
MGKNKYIFVVSMVVALGGFLMGFDASVISGVNRFIEIEFDLSKIELGWAVASLTLTATLSMLVAGPLSDKIGRKRVLSIAAILYTISAIGSALAPSFIVLVIARMIGGLGVGASLIIAPMYIAEMAPPKIRGSLVSINQLNIVLGISVAFFTNYMVLQLGQSDMAWAQALQFDTYNWRWMLGLETIPAVLYFIGLFFVPNSPRWLIMKEEYDYALSILSKINPKETAQEVFSAVKKSFEAEKDLKKRTLTDLFKPALKLVLLVGVVIGILQQITGINAVFFYAPMIFEQTGIGTDASFVQAILVGLTNLVFTVLAILFIDKVGRKPLLIFGVSGIALCMFLLSYEFNNATYTLQPDTVTELPAEINQQQLSAMVGTVYDNDLDYKRALSETLGEDVAQTYESQLITTAADINATLILICILGFVASFAISLGPIMWVLFSEIFPNYIRGLAISFVGVINSAISFGVQLVFPWELANFGSSLTFLIYGVFAAAGLLFIIFVVPETKGKSLEELEIYLAK